jgi:hypothetical protein
MRRGLCALTLAGLAIASACSEPAPSSAPASGKRTMLVMTALPMFWGEGGPQAVLSGGDQRGALIRHVEKSWRVTPVDRMEGLNHVGDPVLLVAQPRGLRPEEFVALDNWVREGGRAILFADPMLVWPSSLAVGDPRRAPAIMLLDPVLDHWGLSMESPAEANEAVLTIDGRAAVGAAMGHWASKSKDCLVSADRRWVECRIGKGRAVLVADADLLDFDGIAGNEAAVDALIARVAL